MTVAIVKNGVVMKIADSGYYTTDDGFQRPIIIAKEFGFYEYIENPPTLVNQKVASTSLSIDDVTGTVTKQYVIVDKTAEEIKNETNSKLDAQIVSSERQALETGLVRTLVEDLMNRALDQAGLLLGMTLPLSGVQKESIEAMLLDEQGQYFSKPYAKIHANAAERAALRTQRI